MMNSKLKEREKAKMNFIKFFVQNKKMNICAIFFFSLIVITSKETSK